MDAQRWDSTGVGERRRAIQRRSGGRDRSRTSDAASPFDAPLISSSRPCAAMTSLIAAAIVYSSPGARNANGAPDKTVHATNTRRAAKVVVVVRRDAASGRR